MKYVQDSKEAPEAVGPYSQAVEANGFAFLSGQIAIDRKIGAMIKGSVEDETRQVIHNVTALLSHLGLSISNVTKATIFLTDINDFKKVNEIYGAWVGDNKPARSTIQVAALPLGAKVEIEVIAVSSK